MEVEGVWDAGRKQQGILEREKGGKADHQPLQAIVNTLDFTFE